MAEKIEHPYQLTGVVAFSLFHAARTAIETGKRINVDLGSGNVSSNFELKLAELSKTLSAK